MLKKFKNSINFSFYDNINKLEDILNSTNPDIIINAIGLVSVDACENNHQYAYDLNENFVKILVNTLHKLKMNNCYLVHISSGGVYGKRSSLPDKPWIETDKLNPMSIYAKSKIQGENQALKFEGPKLIIRSDFYGMNPIQIDLVCFHG